MLMVRNLKGAFFVLLNSIHFHFTYPVWLKNSMMEKEHASPFLHIFSNGHAIEKNRNSNYEDGLLPNGIREFPLFSFSQLKKKF